MSSIENMIAWMQARKGKVTYSMTSRMGPNSYDCSSSVFFAMIAGGFLSAGSMGNTETLFGMSGTKLKEIRMRQAIILHNNTLLHLFEKPRNSRYRT